MPGNIQSVGCDWITCTASTISGCEALDLLGESIAVGLRANGHVVNAGQVMSYRGWQSDGFFHGIGHQGSYLRLSGAVAHRLGREAASTAENVSRIDFEVTVVVEPSTRPLTEVARDEFTAWAKGQRRQPTWRYHYGSDGGHTCEFGSRSSEQCGRIYDKHVESKGAYPAGSWRFEVEIKGDRAKLQAEVMKSLRWGEAYVQSYVSHWFSSRGITVPFLGRSASSAIQSPAVSPVLTNGYNG